MAFTLDSVVPWGRSFEEYVAMFSLSERDLGLRILDCADGPASFNAVLTQRGGTVISLDPMYQFSQEELRARISETYEHVLLTVDLLRRCAPPLMRNNVGRASDSSASLNAGDLWTEVWNEMVRGVTSADCDAIARIYNHYIANTIITFEEQVVEPSEIAARAHEVESASLPWLVAEVDGEVVGYAYASKWKGRSAYRFSVEITVYLDPDHRGKGLGTMLFHELFAILQSKGIHVAISGIALPNEASVALAEKFGMEKVAHFREVGYKFGRWIDVGYWQRTL